MATITIRPAWIRGTDTYHLPLKDQTVYFENPELGVVRQLIDRQGMIQNFPGVVHEECWEKEYTLRRLTEEVRFGMQFEQQPDGRYLVKWDIQPDGLYWMDSDGFGAEMDLPISLYTYLDEKGQFTGPFRVYKVGQIQYYTEG